MYRAPNGLLIAQQCIDKSADAVYHQHHQVNS